MKRILAGMILICLALAAGAETVPDGTVYNVFRVTYDESTLKDWQTMTYLDAAGFLFSASIEDAEITVSVDESGVAQSAAEFLRRHVSNVSRYGRVTSYSGPYSWDNPWNVEGASMRYHYMYLNGSNTDDEYQTAMYVAPFSSNYFIVISVNAWGVKAAERIRMFETEFLPSLNVGTQMVSTQFVAYLKDAWVNEAGETEVELDFCAVEFDLIFLSVYAVNDEPVGHTYKVRSDALVYLPASGETYNAVMGNPDQETLRRAIDEYYRLNDAYAIYQVLFDKNDEIVWMMHYNAF